MSLVKCPVCSTEIMKVDSKFPFAARMQCPVQTCKSWFHFTRKGSGIDDIDAKRNKSLDSSVGYKQALNLDWSNEKLDNYVHMRKESANGILAVLEADLKSLTGTVASIKDARFRDEQSRKIAVAQCLSVKNTDDSKLNTQLTMVNCWIEDGTLSPTKGAQLQRQLRLGDDDAKATYRRLLRQSE